MISGVHAILFSPRAAEVRAFLRDVLAFESVEAGEDWPVYALPPSELAVHPAETPGRELYLQTDDLDAAVAALAAKGVPLARPVTSQAWGRLTALALPDGSEIALYEPRHARPPAARG